ncbi:hypothetical protein ACFLYX_04115 [Chloroflexota bacterium]
MRIERLFKIRRSRKYPIQRDNRGQSLRTRCFELFDEEKGPVEVAKELGMKESTAIRYFQQWKVLGPNFERKYAYIKGLLKQSAPDRDRTLELLAKACGIPKEELETILARPNGLRRLMTGKFYLTGHANADHKLHVVLEAALFISDYLTKSGGKFEDVRFALERWMKESMDYRRRENADIQEENRDIALMRQVFEAAAKAEQQGQAKRDRLTKEEINTILRWKLESKARSLEISYWFRIAELRDEGLTIEQAREKIYQDLLEKGDVKGAKMMRSYQDMVHPLKGDDHDPPTSPSEPTSPA